MITELGRYIAGLARDAAPSAGLLELGTSQMRDSSLRTAIGLAVCLWGCVAAESDAAPMTVLAGWNFNNSATRNTPTSGIYQTQSTLVATGGTSIGGETGRSANLAEGEEVGEALSMGFKSGQPVVLDFSFPTLHASDLQMSFGADMAPTSSTTVNVTWAVGDGSFSNPVQVLGIPHAFAGAAVMKIDLTGVDALEGEPLVHVRLTASSTSTQTRALAIDNLRFEALTVAPEPGTALLACSAFAILGRRRRA